MELLTNLFIKVEIYILLLIALNSLMLGKLNLWAIEIIVYFSIGAFGTGFFSNCHIFSGWNLYWLFILLPFFCALLSLLVLYISRILKQDFFLFFSLLLIELNFVLNNIVAGPGGYSHIRRPPGLESDLSLSIVGFIMVVLLSLWIGLFNLSRVNLLHTLIRNNEILANSFGINIYKTQKPIFVSSAIIAGSSGILFAFFSFGADPQAFNTNQIIILFTLIILGGIDSIKGSIIAGFIFVFMTFFLDSILSSEIKIIAPKLSQIIFGLLLVLIPYYLPKGLFGNRFL